MKTLFKLALTALVFTAVSCADKKEEPAPVQVIVAPAPAPAETPAPEEPKTKVDVKLNTKDGTIGVDVEKK